MPYYTAYGLRIRSFLFLPGLPSDEGPPDVDIRLGRLNRRPKALVKEGCLRVSKNQALLSWQDVGAFLISDGREIIVYSSLETDDRLLRLFIVGPPLGILLHQREQLVLHASAVSIDGEIVAFLAGSGCGKSTIAAALHARGHGVVADDVLAADATRENPTVHSGFPQLKLWPKAATLLTDIPDNLPRLHPRFEKRACPAIRGFQLNQCGSDAFTS
ncbi:MAG TPA: hypothetical protein VGL91_02400 [Acidobacteriota bacterium]|jgi:hypothetical protein